MISERFRLAVQSLLIEGFIDDLAQKTDRGDELRTASEQATERGLPLDKQKSYLQWMLKVAGSEPFEDIVGDLVTHFQTKQSNRLKGPDADINSYKSVGELRQKLEAMAPQKSTKEGNADVIGKFGPWTVYMPHDKESSCQLGAGTTWCTAKRSGQNLFYNYVAKGRTILYYVIRDEADPIKYPTSKLSIGVVDGRIILDGQSGHVSVDASNAGLTEESVREILGGQTDDILKAIRAHSQGISGKHPAETKIELMRKNLPALQAATRDLDEEARDDLLEQILKEKVTPEIAIKILSLSNSMSIRSAVAKNAGTGVDTLIKLSKNSAKGVAWSLVRNPNTPAQALFNIIKKWEGTEAELAFQHENFPIDKLIEIFRSKSAPYSMKMNVLLNKSLPPEFLDDVAMNNPGSWLTVNRVITNPNTSTETLKKLFDLIPNHINQQDAPGLLAKIAKADNTPAEILDQLSEIDDFNIQENVASNPNTSKSTLAKLTKIAFEDPHKRPAARALAANPNLSTSDLDELAQHDKYDVRKSVAGNPTTSVGTLLRLIGDADIEVVERAIEHPKMPIKNLIEFSVDDEWTTREAVARNPNTPIHILNRLSQDQNGNVRATAQRILQKRQQTAAG